MHHRQRMGDLIRPPQLAVLSLRIPSKGEACRCWTTTLSPSTKKGDTWLSCRLPSLGDNAEHLHGRNIKLVTRDSVEPITDHTGRAKVHREGHVSQVPAGRV